VQITDANGDHHGDTNVAAVASLMADEARANILLALSDGRALTAGELARMARVAPSTASWHLAKLVEGGLLEVESWGKHRYFRVAGPEIVGAMEALAPLAPAKPVRSWRQSRAAGRVRFARTCYDHLAGELGVRFTRTLVDQGTLIEVEDGYEVTEEGLSRLREFGVDLSGRKRQIRFAPRHVDWSERYHHFAGPLAKATTTRLFELGWIERVPASRAVRLSEAGRLGLRERFGLRLEDEGHAGVMEGRSAARGVG
jgi:DNA-binding transcriptional ArsR family regulator